jgi:hypothetical protein
MPDRPRCARPATRAAPVRVASQRWCFAERHGATDTASATRSGPEHLELGLPSLFLVGAAATNSITGAGAQLRLSRSVCRSLGLAAYGERVEGTSFGRYRLQDLLGRGGMGEVWRVYDTATKRIVAIKLLPPQLAADQTFVARFRREAEAAAQLNNPHIIPML